MKPTAIDTMTEVLESKRRVCEETKHLCGAAYFRYLRQEAAALFPDIPTQRELPGNMPNGTGSREASHTRVAEPGGAYGTKGNL